MSGSVFIHTPDPQRRRRRNFSLFPPIKQIDLRSVHNDPDREIARPRMNFRSGKLRASRVHSHWLRLCSQCCVPVTESTQR